MQSDQQRFILRASFVLAFLILGCVESASDRESYDGATTFSDVSPDVSVPEVTDESGVELPIGLPYPFDSQNMFFGLSVINDSELHRYVVEDLDISWVSLQPHLFWLAIESEPGVYDWDALASEVQWLPGYH